MVDVIASTYDAASTRVATNSLPRIAQSLLVFTEASQRFPRVAEGALQRVFLRAACCAYEVLLTHRVTIPNFACWCSLPALLTKESLEPLVGDTALAHFFLGVEVT